MVTDQFYASLTPCDRFFDLAKAETYRAAPDDWYVLITDIVGSTRAIRSGRYREVNLLGACSIMAVLNAVGPVEIPFTFGGDGASLLVPPPVFTAARDALLAVRRLARESFGLDLRVGIVPISTIPATHPLKVAKFRVSPTYAQASFMGGGLTYATELIKANPIYRLEASSDHPPADLSGLECRWQDIPSPHGHTLSLIVLAQTSSSLSGQDVYRGVIEEINRIYGDSQNYHPVAARSLRLSFNPCRLWAEVRARSPAKQPFPRLAYLAQISLENLLGACFMGVGLTVGHVDWGHYRQAAAVASDFQKLDDSLRMVIAGRPSQTQALIHYLERELRQGTLVYGLHLSNRALMTCLIFERRDRHIHLIDCADGGYALAAQQLKARLQPQQTTGNTCAL